MGALLPPSEAPKEARNQVAISQMWDQQTGRTGDPPGLGTCSPGSSQQAQVSHHVEPHVESNLFLPMSPEDWEWIMSVSEGANRESDGKEPSPTPSLPGPHPKEPQDWSSPPPPWTPRTP